MTQEPPTAPTPPGEPAPPPRAPGMPPSWVPAPPPGQRLPPGYGPTPGGYPPPPGHPFGGYGVQPPPYRAGPGYGQPPGYYLPPGYPPPPLAPIGPAGQPLASFADRLLAYLIDGAVFMGILAVLAVPTAVAFFAFGPGIPRVQPDGAVVSADFFAYFLALLVLDGVLLLAMLGLYYVYFVELMLSERAFGRAGQTLGKKVMKIRVVPLDPQAALDRKLAAKRFLVQFVAGSFVPGLSYLDGLWQLWDKPYLQCLHDKFARTIVVKVPA